jgi:hypothetical protein|tara:strand:- start:164 stop:322 length:159 start_codon:yes stop_codon:yes gene_type:complete
MNERSTDKVLKDEEKPLTHGELDERMVLDELAGNREMAPEYYDNGPDGCEEW